MGTEWGLIHQSQQRPIDPHKAPAEERDYEADAPEAFAEDEKIYE